jgi:hypothetical protein
MDLREARAFMENIDLQFLTMLDLVKGWRIHREPPYKDVLRAAAGARRIGILPDFETWLSSHYGSFKAPKSPECPKRFRHISEMLTEVLGHDSTIMTVHRAACIARHGEQLGKLDTLLHWIDQNFDLREHSPDVS